jgi:hypothetical protein
MSNLNPPTTDQFGRVCTLFVSTAAGDAIDLSQLRIKFSIKRSDTMTPNSADIRIYNLDLDFAAVIKREFTQVVLQAGYQSNFGVIFKGNIKQVILGRENETDTFIDIIAGDGDQAYNFAIVNTTLAAGSSLSHHIAAASGPMKALNVTPGYTGALPEATLPRGKVMYGNSRDHLQKITSSSGFGWNIQDEKINIVKRSTYLPGTVTILTSKTGLIGTPQQTNIGVNCKCLINPNIKINGRIQINNASVELLKINLSVPGSADNVPAPVADDGVYSVMVVQHTGDTRGIPWYSEIVALSVLVTSNPLNAITVGGGY